MRTRSNALLAAGIATLVGTGIAQAKPGTVEWPTFFRTGPGTHFVAIQELSRGSDLDVQSCDGQWCLVQIGRVSGYVEANNIGTQPPASAFRQPANNAGCFDSQRAGYEKGEDFKYCPR